MNTELQPFDDGSEYEDDGTPRPWSTQPGEGAVEFMSFRCYRDFPPHKRSAAAVARHLGIDVNRVRNMAAKFSWKDRALSFDTYIDNRAVDELVSGRAKMRLDDVATARIAKEKIVEGLKNLDPGEMSPRDLATWYDLAVKVERQARGEPDKVTRIEGELSVIDQLDTAARRALMGEAMRVLAERLGEPQGVLEADVVEDEDGRTE